MRILIIVPDAVQYGGACHFLERILDIHRRHEIDTMLLVTTAQCYPVIVSLTERYGVELILSPNFTESATPPFMTPFFDLLFSWRTVRSWKPDLIVVSTSGPGRMSIALYYPVPVLYILHSIPEFKFRFLPRFYLRLGMLFNNLVMTVSEAAAQLISKFMGIPEEKIAVVYNSCQYIKRPVCARLPVVLTVGHVVPYKNPAGWLAVAQMVVLARPDVSFVWVGDGELLDSMRSQVNAIGLDGRIKFTGYAAEPSTWYETAQVYFQPSLQESHGIAVLEAMSHGLPCVVSNAGGLPESVLDGETGYVCPPADFAGFAGCIAKLLSDSALCNLMGTAGSQRVEKCFSEEVQESKIMAIYERIIIKPSEK